jgi:molecular chaperone GrpE
MQNQENSKKEPTHENEEMRTDTDIKAESGQETDEKTVNDITGGSEAKINELNDKYLRLYSEYDNYRKRTMKERSDLLKTASEDTFKAILPVIDDLERALKANETADDIESVKKGLQLIYNKLKNSTQQKGLTSFESKGETFNPDLMEAITHVPATDDDQKGKVIDEVEKGYKLGDKVIRFAKVVIAQ